MNATTPHRLLAVIVIRFFLLCEVAVGQAVYGNINGTVNDASGAAVANAVITITDTDRGGNYTTTTNERHELRNAGRNFILEANRSLEMNRREMLRGTGVVAGSAAVKAVVAQNSFGPAQPERKCKIVVTGGHPGDPEYGCGGTIARLTALGHEVVLLYMNDGAWHQISAATRIAEAKKACEILKARPAYANQINGHSIVDNAHYQSFQGILEAENPDAVFTHWFIDNHPDHRAIANLTYESWKQLKHSFALYYYEVSDGEDTTEFAAPTHYVDITDVIDMKKAACYAHASQSPGYYYGVQDTVANFRGLQSGSKRAEAYILQLGSTYDIFPRMGLRPR
jgi:N-acetylglucosamine malate deacetylase 1